LIEAIACEERVHAQEDDGHAGIGHTAAIEGGVTAGEACQRADLVEAGDAIQGFGIGGEEDGSIDTSIAQGGGVGADHIAQAAGFCEGNGFGCDQQDVQGQSGLLAFDG
jgi:hypothetical protein